MYILRNRECNLEIFLLKGRSFVWFVVVVFRRAWIVYKWKFVSLQRVWYFMYVFKISSRAKFIFRLSVYL